MKNFKPFMIRLLFRLLPLAYMGLIWLLSSYPSDAVVDTGTPYDRTFKESLHLIEFGILYMLVILALLSYGKLNHQSSFMAACFSVFYGLTDEIHQYFVPSRSASVVDLLKDAIGVYAAWYLINKALLVPGSKMNLILKKLEEKTK